MKVRSAIPEDVPFMLALERQCPTAAHWEEERYRKLFDPSDEMIRRQLLIAELPPRSTTSHEPLEPVGFLVARHMAPEWELENIVVSSAARRKGIGSGLLAALIAAARETDSEAVFLEVRESNTAARRLYERAGFKPIASRKSYYSNPLEDAVVYRRDLG